MKSKINGNSKLVSVQFVYNHSEKVSLVLRYSYYYVFEEEENYDQQAIIGELDFRLRKNISIMPNIMYNDYNFKTKQRIGKDIISRITVSYEF